MLTQFTTLINTLIMSISERNIYIEINLLHIYKEKYSDKIKFIY